jgi:hypothetical protein
MSSVKGLLFLRGSFEYWEEGVETPGLAEKALELDDEKVEADNIFNKTSEGVYRRNVYCFWFFLLR